MLFVLFSYLSPLDRAAAVVEPGRIKTKTLPAISWEGLDKRV